VWFVRHGIPIAIIVAGLVVLAVAHPPQSYEGGFGIMGAGLAVWLLNWTYRIGASGDREREEEEAARRYFDEHGHWPDERPT